MFSPWPRDATHLPHVIALPPEQCASRTVRPDNHRILAFMAAGLNAQSPWYHSRPLTAHPCFSSSLSHGSLVPPR